MRCGIICYANAIAYKYNLLNATIVDKKPAPWGPAKLLVDVSGYSVVRLGHLAVHLGRGYTLRRLISVRNAYTIKLLNKAATPHAFDLKAEGADVKMAIVGAEAGKPVTVPADGSESVRVTLTMVHPQNAKIRFTAKDVAGKEMLSAVDRFVAQ